MSNILLFVIPVMNDLGIAFNDKNVKEFCSINKIRQLNLSLIKNENVKKKVADYIEQCNKDNFEDVFSSALALEKYKKIPKNGQIEDLLIGIILESLKFGDTDITEESFNLDKISVYENKYISKYIALLKTFYPNPDMWAGAHRYWSNLALEVWNE